MVVCRRQRGAMASTTTAHLESKTPIQTGTKILVEYWDAMMHVIANFV